MYIYKYVYKNADAFEIYFASLVLTMKFYKKIVEFDVFINFQDTENIKYYRLLFTKSGIFLKELLLSISSVPVCLHVTCHLTPANSKVQGKEEPPRSSGGLMSCQRLEQRLLQVGYFLKQTNRRRPVVQFKYQIPIVEV
ncbi:hypothetical protein T01_7708 [Trichinella spiralis]|uniref:Uncharacterized protein n=1 Tax=Trichinella spiralis TaxID=6334 RepID=A0A0V1BVG2_TRISP|nr:hypothetical protein T01_7708 [Trichinella spiralis]